MSQKRNEQSSDSELEARSAVTLSEVARVAATPLAEKAAPKDDGEHISLFWRVFGGTIVSMVALGAITLYNNLSANIAELRVDLTHEREARAELVKKDEFNTRLTTQYERIRSYENLKSEFEVMKERVNGNVAALDALKKDTTTAVDTIRREVEASRKDVATIDVLKEKLATASECLKSLRDDMSKLQQEQERGKLNELERKVSQEVQAKQVDSAIKELQKGLQECREKLARLEGLRNVGGSVPDVVPASTRPLPVVPAETKGPGETGAGSGKVPPNERPNEM